MDSSSIINIADLMERVDDNSDFARMMLEKFFETYLERINEINDNIAEENYEELKNNAHKLKGIVGNLSLVNCFNTIYLLEKSALSKNKNDCILKVAISVKHIQEAQKYLENNPDILPVGDDE